MQRTVEGPSKEWVTEREFSDFLGISLDAFRRAVRDGKIPPSRKWTHKTRLWHAEVVIWVNLGMKLGLIHNMEEKNLAPG